MYANFLLGEINTTDDVLARLNRIPLDLLARHAINEHGRLTKLERKRNQLAMRNVGRILSRYPINPLALSEGFVIVETKDGWGETEIRLESEDENA